MTHRFALDPNRGRFTVQAFASGLLSGFGHSPTFAVRDYQGALLFDADAGAGSSFALSIEAASLHLNDKLSDKDRQEIEQTLQNDVLESARFPRIGFCSTGIAVTRIAGNWFRAQLRGIVQLHGVSRPYEIDSQLRIADDGAHLAGEFSMSQTAFNIRRTSAIGGMIRVKDDLKFAFDLFGADAGEATS